MLQPKRTKFRKMQKGRNRGLAQSGNKVSFGEFGLKAVERGRPRRIPMIFTKQWDGELMEREGEALARFESAVDIDQAPAESIRALLNRYAEAVTTLPQVNAADVLRELRAVYPRIADDFFTRQTDIGKRFFSIAAKLARVENKNISEQDIDLLHLCFELLIQHLPHHTEELMRNVDPVDILHSVTDLLLHGVLGKPAI